MEHDCAVADGVCVARGSAHVSAALLPSGTHIGGRASTDGGEGAGVHQKQARDTQHESPTTAQPSLLMRAGVH
jgi:hypothetical protein